MRYQGSEAYSMDVAERRRERLEQQAAPSFEVVTGGGLDARVRAGVSPTFVARLRAVLVVAAALVALGMVRVGISAATVSLLSSNSALSSQIKEATTLNDQLSVQRSVLSSNARIARIATQNYGMVLTGDAVTIEVTSQEGEQPADGEAAQTADDAAAQASVS
ncbi:MAG TPA: cell division protein FtsL [Candidatus Olsenella stercoravium]|uniref:Cell division protein FtsL n=1 Tax=Candidatus Olsenella stercoravium TaxID=2838713 RepID=A0A9D2IPK9_9ACTN|nr:cell division protein FtsL [Candidatus Olsenella stercoravium]